MKIRWGSLIRYKSWSLAMKLAVVFSVLMATVIVAIGAGSYLSYRNSIREQIQALVPQTLVQVNRHLDTYISQMISISQEILKSPYSELFEAFEHSWQEAGRKPTIDNSLLLNQAIQFVSRGYDSNLLGLIFYSNDGYAYIRDHNGGGSWTERDYRKEDWYGQDRGTSLFILGTRRELLFEHDLKPDKAPYGFTMMQPIPDKSQSGVSGILQITGDLESVSAILRGMDMGPGSGIYVVDDYGKIVYAHDKELLGRKWNSAYGIDLGVWRGDTGSQVIGIGEDSYLASYSQSANTRWTVISMIPMQYLTQGISTVSAWTIGMIIIAVLVSALFALMIAYGFTNPIRYLSKQLNKLDEHNMRKIGRSERTDEVGQLWNAYEGMVSRIRVLVEEVLKSKLLKQEAEIRALRSQINPHFINNAMESIRMTLVRGRIEQAETALVCLGDIMRYHCMQTEELVTARQEIEMVRNVLLIQNIRFGDSLQAEYRIDPAVCDMLMPSFVIQPLVENAIKYGASPDDGCIRIYVDIRVEDGYIFGKVVDEGEGLDSAALEQVIEQMSNPRGGGRQIGLSNIYERIKLIYNSEGELSIDSAKGAGTIVRFRIPAVPCGETLNREADAG